MAAKLPSIIFLLTLTLGAGVLPAAAQARPGPSPTPADAEDALRVSVEEVRVPVAASDAAGRFDRALAPEDLLVREDGVAQQVKGVFRAPADVLLLLDTGGRLSLPSTPDGMLREAAEVAREIGAVYVVTYRPLRPVAESQPGEYRRLDILARRLGLTLRARRGYAVKPVKP